MSTLTHHRQDSTHISFGVVTLGIVSKRVKLEGSLFNGHEPDEKRWDFDPIRLDSASVRLSYNPSPNWSFQVSRGHLDSPEALEPGEDLNRTTASVIYNHPLRRGNWATSLILGQNDEENHKLNGWTLESSLNFVERHYLFIRMERVDKLGLTNTLDPDSGPEVTVKTFSVGYSRNLSRSSHMDTALGAMVTFHDVPGALRPIYGKSPTGFYVFLRIRPSQMQTMSARHSEQPGH